MQIKRLTEAELELAAELLEQVTGKQTDLKKRYSEEQIVVVGCEDETGMHGCGAITSGGEICALAVEEAYRRQGMGRKILDALCTECFQRFSVTRIKVDADLSEVSFYRACAFVPRNSERADAKSDSIPMEKMLVPADTGSSGKNRGMVSVLVVGGILLLVILMGLLFFVVGKVYNYTAGQRVMKEEEWETWEQEPEAEITAEEEKTEDLVTTPRSYTDILKEELSGVELYLEEGLPYELTEEVYTLEEDSKEEHLRFDIRYPQIQNLPDGIADMVNETLKSAAMVNVKTLYTNPSEELKQLFAEQTHLYRESEVGYQVTYFSENYISVVYADHYFMGNVKGEYGDLRTRIINLKTGEVVQPEDTYTADETMAMVFHEKLLEKDGKNEAFRGLPDDVFKRTLEGEIVDGRYMSGMVLTKNGVLLTFTYHYRSTDGNLISRGWEEVEFSREEFIPYEKGHEMWKLVESDN